MSIRTQVRPSPRAVARRVARPVSAVALAGAMVLCVALPASAAEGLGEKSPSGLSPLETALIFFGIPALVIAVVYAVVYGLSRNSEPRLREGQSWWTEPDYNTRESIGVQVPGADHTGEAPRTTDGGGTGATW